MKVAPAFRNSFLLILLFTNCYLKGQSVSHKDSLLVNQLNREAWEIRNEDPDLSYQKAHQAEIIALSTHLKYELSVSYSCIGSYYKNTGDPDSAWIYFSKSLDIRNELKDTLSQLHAYRNLMYIKKMKGELKGAINIGLISMALAKAMASTPQTEEEKAILNNQMATLYLETGDYNNSLKLAYDAYFSFSKAENKSGLAKACLTLGNIFEEQESYEKAIKYLVKALEIQLQTGNKKDLAKVYNNLGNVYFAMNKYNEAFSYYSKCLSIRQANHIEEDIPGTLFNMGVIYEARNLNKLAEKFFIQSLHLFKKTGNRKGVAESLTKLGLLRAEQNRFKEALGYLSESAIILDTATHKPEDLLIYKSLSTCYKNIGIEDSALYFLEKYNYLSDELINNYKQSVASDRELSEKKHELEISKSQIKIQYFIILVLVLTVILFASLYYTIYQKSLSEKKLSQLTNKIKLLEISSIDAMMKGQEKERNILAAELHDSLGSLLTGMKFYFRGILKNESRTTISDSDSLNKFEGLIDEALSNTRQISHSLSSGISEMYSLPEALANFCNRVNESNEIKIDLNIHGLENRLNIEIELNLYRIILELITNVLKHAEATVISIQILKSDSNLNLILEDNGKGFNTDTKKISGGIGWKNIRERLELISGTVQIDSAKGKGSTVIINIPNPENN